MDDHFGVATGSKAVSLALQISAQLLKVVDFAVENDLNRAVFIANRLITSAHIDDRQPAVHEPDTRLNDESLRVRAAVSDAITHGLKNGPLSRPGRVGIQDTGNSTHRLLRLPGTEVSDSSPSEANSRRLPQFV